MVEALVEYNYEAQESDELTIKKGDIIRDIVKKPGGWWEGVLNDKKGVFPDNFVKVIDRDAGVILRNKKDSCRIRQCRVIFSYKPYHEDELNLNVDDVIDVIGEEEEGWWRGLLHGKEGVFPSNFVEEIFPSKIKAKRSKEDLTNAVNDNDVNSPSLPPKPARTLCKVIYPYKAQNEDELTLEEGDDIVLLSKDGQDVGWWRGEMNGRVGVFPDNFVVIIPHSDDKQMKDDRELARTVQEPGPLKPSAIVSQRKSLEVRPASENKAPPVVGKKPIVPIKKSPTSSASAGGILSGLFGKKAIDIVDGSAGSKGMVQGNKFESKTEEDVFEFDQVKRSNILTDVRATRVKAPGRRLPSNVKEEPGVVNGNAEHVHMDSSQENTSTAIEENPSPVKPKVREWQKHKAPWLEEMKLNQAKRTTPTPSPDQSRLKLTPTNVSPDVDETKSTKTSPYEKDTSPIDMSKSMPSLGSKLEASPSDIEKVPVSVMLRSRPVASTRPETVTITEGLYAVKRQTFDTTKETNSLDLTNTKGLHLPKQHTVASERTESKASGDSTQETISSKQYSEVIERLLRLEFHVEKQKAAIEELQGKLKVETDLRVRLQAELEKVAQCVHL